MQWFCLYFGSYIIKFLAVVLFSFFAVLFSFGAVVLFILGAVVLFSVLSVFSVHILLVVCEMGFNHRSVHIVIHVTFC